MNELDFAHELADIADDIAMRYFRRDMKVRSKRDGSPVTQADEEIERKLREAIAEAFPDHGIFGEEEGETAGASGSRWILDPIDGTKNFSWGIPVWATLIALETDDRIVCGVASAPALDERFAAARDEGATRNGERIHVSDRGSIDDARVGFTSVRAFKGLPGEEAFGELVNRSAHDRGIGDFYGHMLVASGSLDVMLEPQLRPWDIGPLLVIVEEAGGRLTDFDGQAQIYGGGAVTTNGRLHDPVMALFSA